MDRVLHTRERAEPLQGLLLARGMRPVHVPLIARRPTGSPPPVGHPGRVLVTSAGAVAHAAGLAAVIGDAMVVAVGEATAAALRQAGVQRITVGPGGGAGAVARLAALEAAHPGPIWHVRGARTSRTVAGALSQAGLAPVPWTVYATGPVAGAREALAGAGPVAVVCFASGSAARAYTQAGGRVGPRFVVIGADTAAEARRAGLPVHGVAASPTAVGLADAAARALSGPSAG